MKRWFRPTLVAAALCGHVLGGCHGRGCGAATREGAILATDHDRTLYALGLDLGRTLSVFQLDDRERVLVEAGLADQVLGREPRLDARAWQEGVQGLARARHAAAAEAEKGRARDLLAAAAQEPGALRTPSGLVFRSLAPGAGEAPGPTDRVKVRHRGTLADGTVVDGSAAPGQPAELRLDMVVPCWSEGLQRMRVGGKARLTCPSSLAYGDNGRPPTIPGGATLIFEIELLSVEGAGRLPAGPGVNGSAPLPL